MGQRSRSHSNAPARGHDDGPNPDWLWGLGLFLIVVLVYQPLWYAGFVWDDKWFVLSNPAVIGPLGLTDIWTSDSADICPLTVSLFWAEWQLWRDWPLPWHVVDVVLQGAAAICLWQLLKVLRVPGAWLGAALWAVHPAGVESVAWITETKNTLSAPFFLLSAIFYVRSLEEKASPWNYRASVLCAALAVTAKSSTIVLPVVLALCAWWMQRRWDWRNVLRLAPMVALSVIGAALSIATSHAQRAADVATFPLSWPEKVIIAGRAIWFYLAKLLWPWPQMIVYPRWQIHASTAVEYLPVFAAIVVLGLFWLKRKGWGRAWFFAFGCFVVGLLPVLGFAEFYLQRYSFVGDHLQYLPAMAPLALAGAGLSLLAARFAAGQEWLHVLVGAVLVAGFGGASWQRVWVFHDDTSLWTDAVSKNPACWTGYYNLGVQLAQHGHVPEAKAEFERALDLRPDYTEAEYNLAGALIQEKRIDEAESHLRHAIAVNPRYAHAQNNLANVLLARGHLDEAIEHYRLSLRDDPYNPEVHTNLGYAYQRAGRNAESLRQFEMAAMTRRNFFDVLDWRDLKRAKQETPLHTK